MQGHSNDELLIPVQTLAELYTVLVRKAGMSPDSARARVLQWSDAYVAIDTTSSVLVDAMELVVSHRIGFWDAVIVASAAFADCRFVLTEDMQDGFTWRGVTIRNPFAAA